MFPRQMFLPAIVLVVLSAAGPAEAQTYPDRPIRLVVPFPPGGPTDYVGAAGRTIFVGASGTGGARQPPGRKRHHLLAGQMHMAIEGATTLLPHIASG